MNPKAPKKLPVRYAVFADFFKDADGRKAFRDTFAVGTVWYFVMHKGEMAQVTVRSRNMRYRRGRGDTAAVYLKHTRHVEKHDVTFVLDERKAQELPGSYFWGDDLRRLASTPKAAKAIYVEEFERCLADSTRRAAESVKSAKKELAAARKVHAA